MFLDWSIYPRSGATFWVLNKFLKFVSGLVLLDLGPWNVVNLKSVHLCSFYVYIFCGGIPTVESWDALVGGSRVLRACAVITVFYIFGKIKTRFDLIWFLCLLLVTACWMLDMESANAKLLFKEDVIIALHSWRRHTLYNFTYWIMTGFSAILFIVAILQVANAFSVSRSSIRGTRFSLSMQQATPFQLVLLRHGESTWNEENKFTGWYDYYRI